MTAVASARQECAQLLCLLHFSNRCMHNLRIARLATLEGESVGVKKKDKGKQKSRNQRRRDARGGT